MADPLTKRSAYCQDYAKGVSYRWLAMGLGGSGIFCLTMNMLKPDLMNRLGWRAQLATSTIVGFGLAALKGEQAVLDCTRTFQKEEIKEAKLSKKARKEEEAQAQIEAHNARKKVYEEREKSGKGIKHQGPDNMK